MLTIKSLDFRLAYVSEKHFEIFTCPLSFLDPLLYNVAQRVKILLVNKNENTDTVFCICIKHDSKARNRNLAFASGR